MNSPDFAHQLARFPILVRDSGRSNVDVLQDLLKRWPLRSLAIVDALQRELRLDSALMDEWQIWSDDQRTDAGWYIKHERKRYVIRRIDNLDGDVRMEFSERSVAFAIFILLDTERTSRYVDTST